MDRNLKVFTKFIKDDIVAHFCEGNSVKIYQVKREQIGILTQSYHFPSKIVDAVEISGKYLFLCEGKGLFNTKSSAETAKKRKSGSTPILIRGSDIVVGCKTAVKIAISQNGVVICCKNENYWEVGVHILEANQNSDLMFKDTMQMLAKFKSRTDIEGIPFLTTISTNTLNERTFFKLFASAACEMVVVALPDNRVFYFPATIQNHTSINAKLLCCINQPVNNIFVYSFNSTAADDDPHQALLVIGVHGLMVIFTDCGGNIAVDFLHIPSPVVKVSQCSLGIISHDGKTVWKTTLTKAQSDLKQLVSKKHAQLSVPTCLTFATLPLDRDKKLSSSVLIIREDCRLQLCDLEVVDRQMGLDERNVSDALAIENILSEIHSCSNTLESLAQQQEKQKKLLEEMSIAAQFFHNRQQASKHFRFSCQASLERRDNSIYLILHLKITNQGPIALVGPHWHLIVSVSHLGPDEKSHFSEEIGINKTCPLLSGFGMRETLESHVVREVSGVRGLCTRLPLLVTCHLQYSVPKDHTCGSQDSERMSLFLVQIASYCVDALDFARSSKAIGNQPEFNICDGGIKKSLENIARVYREGKKSLGEKQETSSRILPSRTVRTCLTLRKRHTSCFKAMGGIQGTEMLFNCILRKEVNCKESECKYTDHLFGFAFEFQIVDRGDLFQVEISCPGNILNLLTKTIGNRLKVPCAKCRFDSHVPAKCLSRIKVMISNRVHCTSVITFTIKQFHNFQTGAADVPWPAYCRPLTRKRRKLQRIFNPIVRRSEEKRLCFTPNCVKL